MKEVKIRFNTQNQGSLFWRVLIDGEEKLADEIFITCPCHTSQDKLPNGDTKFHITAFPDSVQWKGTILNLD